jgi:5-deoxy-glucuronate isomerase
MTGGAAHAETPAAPAPLGAEARPATARPGLSPAAPLVLRRAGAPGRDGAIQSIDPDDAGWTYVSFAAHRLGPGETLAVAADDREHLVLILEGHAATTLGDSDLGVLGTRRSVFDGPPPPVLLAAPGVAVSLRAEDDILVVVAAAPGGPVNRTAAIGSDEILVEQRGSGQTARRIHHLLPPAAQAGRLIAFEVFTPGGNWSSWPPHKHDTEDPPREAYLEELYFYRFARPQGFAFQRVYTPDRSVDESLAPGDCDVVLVPRGYHPVGVPAGYDCYYLNVMAGHARAWHFTIDPDHAWQMNWDPAAPRTAQEDTPK